MDEDRYIYQVGGGYANVYPLPLISYQQNSLPPVWTLGQRAAVSYRCLALYLYETLSLVEMKTDTSSLKWPATVLSECVV